MTEFKRKLPIEVEHNDYVVIGWVEYVLPSQSERISLAKEEDESKNDYSLRLNKLILQSITGCSLDVYSKVKNLPLQKYKEDKKKLNVVNKINDHKKLMYYDLIDKIFPILTGEYGRGAPLSDDLLGN